MVLFTVKPYKQTDSVSLSRGRSLPGSHATRPVCHSMDEVVADLHYEYTEDAVRTSLGRFCRGQRVRESMGARPHLRDARVEGSGDE